MGAFYNSICIPGHHRESIRNALVRWLSVKGFELRGGPVLFDLDGDQERSLFLVSNPRWTVLFYSHFDEERRLIRELQTELSPILYLWVQDSEAWGYDVFNPNGFAMSHASDPRIHQSFPDEPMGSERPRGDAANLCRLLDLQGKVAELRRIERLRMPFKEDICAELCRELGVEVAASSYDDLESGTVGDTDDWRSEQLLFVLRDLTTVSAEIDLHQYDLKRLQPDIGYTVSENVELSPEILAGMKRMRQRVRQNHRLLRPLSFLARAWNLFLESQRRLSQRKPTASRAAPPVPPVQPHPVQPHSHFRMESAVLRNDRHRCRITLADGVRPITVSTKPASVFAFETFGVTITCTARRLSKIDEVLRKPDRSKVHYDESYQVSGFPVRHLIFELPPGFTRGLQEPSYLTVYVIQTPRALYVFPHRSRTLLPEPAVQAIRATVDSFRLLKLPLSPRGERKG